MYDNAVKYIILKHTLRISGGKRVKKWTNTKWEKDKKWIKVNKFSDSSVKYCHKNHLQAHVTNIKYQKTDERKEYQKTEWNKVNKTE
jgi:hypothetical protein